MSERKPETISRGAAILRKIFLLGMSPMFARPFRRFVQLPDLDQETVDLVGNNLPKLSEYLKQGLPAIVIFTHFSEKDIPTVSKFGFEHPELGKRSFLFPVGLHQLKRFVSVWGARLGMETVGVVTASTLEHAEKHPEFKDSYSSQLERKGAAELTEEYLKRALDTAKRGGAIWIAPQGRREERLYTHTSAVWSLAKRLNKEKINAVMVYLGLELEGNQDYSSNGYNLGRGYIVRVGRIETIEDLIQRAVDAEIRNPDVLIRRALLEAAPPTYLPESGS